MALSSTRSRVHMVLLAAGNRHNHPPSDAIRNGIAVDLPIDIEELIRSVDDSGNGEIEYEEFEKMLKDKSSIRMA